MLRVRSLAVILMVGSACALTAANAAAETCSTWVGGSGSWSDPSDWSPAGVPATGADVCINEPGTYTVTISSPANALGSLTLGAGAGNGTQTLDIETTNTSGGSIELTLDGASTVDVGGVLELDASATGGASTYLDGAGPLTNDGTIETLLDTGGKRYLETPIVNHGVVGIGAPSVQDTDVTMTNYGTWSIGGTGSYADTAGPFVNDGAIENDSTFEVSENTTFTQAGTGNSGNAIELSSASLDDSSGGGSFTLVNSDYVSGTIPAGQTVSDGSTSGGNGILVFGTAQGNSAVTNDGTITLDSSTNGGNTYIEGGTLTNDGLFESLEDSGGTRNIEMKMVNDGAVVIADQETYESDSDAITNDGTWTVDPGDTYAIQDATFDNKGAIANNGAFTFEQSTFTQEGTGNTGNPIVGGAGGSVQLVDSSGAGSFTFVNTDYLTGTIPAGQTIGVGSTNAGNGALVFATASANFSESTNEPVTNNGTITLDSSTSGGNTYIEGGTLTNNGTFESLQDSGGTRNIQMPMVNDGTVEIGCTQTAQQTGGSSTPTITNNGSWIIEPDVQYQTNGGTWTQSSSGTLELTIDPSKGTTLGMTGSGTAVTLGGTLDLDTLGAASSGAAYTALNGNVTGSFTTVQDTGPTYSVTYPTNQVKLTNSGDSLAVDTASLPDASNGASYSETLQAGGGTGSYTWQLVNGDGSLPAGLTLSSSGVISGTPTGSPGTSDFTVQVTDSDNDTAASAIAITVSPQGLEITTTSLPAGGLNVPGYSQQLAAGGGTTPYVWTVADGVPPAGLTLSSSGLISGTPTGPAGTSNFVVEATDNSNPAQSTLELLSITVNPAPLQIGTTSLPNGQIGQSYSQGVTASGGTSPYTWSLVSGDGALPTGLSIDPFTGVISGKPAGTSGTANFTVQVTDSEDPAVSVTQALSITVDPAPLRIGTNSLPGGEVGQSYNQTLSASGGTTPYTWSLVTGDGLLPPGLTLSSAGAISGRPTTPAGTATFTVQVTDDDSVSVTQQLSITIAPVPLTISTSSLRGGTVGSPYSQTLSASGGTTPYTWSLVSGDGSLPAGLALNASTGVISGTPSDSGGTSNFTVKAADSASPQQSTTRALSIAIAAPTLSLSTCAGGGACALPAGQVGTPYAQPLVATGGSPPYSWSLASGSLPPGLMLGAGTGVIQGVPLGPTGTSTFTVKLADSSSPAQTATAKFSIAIGRGGLLGGVSCTTGTDCAAVGGQPYASPAIVVPLAETWNGTNWTTVNTPVPNTLGDSTLNALTCPSADACIAVGFFSTGPDASFPMADTWNGTSWSLETIPSPTSGMGSDAILTGVSCVSGNDCVAVGNYDAGGKWLTLAEHWNGTSWSLQSSPNPSNTTNSSNDLTRVSCAPAEPAGDGPGAAVSCTAVGYYESSIGGIAQPFAAHWNGTSWSLETIHGPSGSAAIDLLGVSCPSSTSCTAVGTRQSNSSETSDTAFVERWNGTSWSQSDVAAPTGAVASALAGVSCTSSSACTAVGGYSPNSSTGLPLAERWNGSNWSVETVPAPSAAVASSLGDVSCTSGRACMAVGVFNLSTSVWSLVAFAESWDGSSWSLTLPGSASVSTSTGGTATVSDTVPGAGTLSVSVTGSGAPGTSSDGDALAARAKSFTVAHLTVKVRRAGTVKLKISPDRAAKAILRERGKLAVTITLTFKRKHHRASVRRLRATLVSKRR